MAGIYLHIPFCKTRCVYCDFYSTTLENKQKQYVQALCHELEMRRDYLNKAPIQTIYFGGGTPSQLPIELFEQVFQTLEQTYGLELCNEITVEANPDDLTSEYVNGLRRLPFNRISIGIQTFQDPMLRLLNRRHTAQQAIEAVKRCRNAGFSNISIDLMYGLPDETQETWLADIRQAIQLNADHISAYHLIYEEGTRLWQMRERRQVKEADEETSIRFFEMLINELTQAGYEHYEISNFCLPGRYARHNMSYWEGTPYLGCGAAAHSYDGKEHRQWNVASIEEYIKGIEQGTPHFDREYLSNYTRYNETVITALRTYKGLSLPMLKEKFGDSLYNYCLNNAQPYITGGKMIIENDTLRISRQGIFVSDGIMSDLLWVEDTEEPTEEHF